MSCEHGCYEPECVVCAYDRAFADGVAKERARVVAWLRARGQSGYRHASYGDSCQCCASEEFSESWAESIESGER